MTLPAEDFDRLKKNVHAMNTGAARLGEAHKMPQSPQHQTRESIQTESLKPAAEMVRRFYPKTKQ